MKTTEKEFFAILMGGLLTLFLAGTFILMLYAFGQDENEQPKFSSEVNIKVDHKSISGL